MSRLVTSLLDILRVIGGIDKRLILDSILSHKLAKNIDRELVSGGHDLLTGGSLELLLDQRSSMKLMISVLGGVMPIVLQ